MIKLTCILRRKPGMSPAQFHAYWRDVHGPLVLGTKSGSHVLRYEQHHRPLDDYPAPSAPDGGGGAAGAGDYDGVTEQWFASMDEYRAHVAEEDFATVWADLQNFLDVEHLAFVLTEAPVIVMDGPRH
ncbi:MAG TPA: EthD domain-containing protein [Acidimicrobiales bacterium]|nr:EthD domain-containing protein [Acidimicrobiales bacterium]